MIYKRTAEVLLLLAIIWLSAEQVTAPAPCNPTCQNGGTCNSGNCVCATGWTGSDCTNAICTPVCQNGGNCTAPNTCTCTSQYNGPSCADPICNSQCENGGSCTAPNTCSCTSNWTGSTCKTPVCSPPCQNGGSCVNPQTCNCPNTYTGIRCVTPTCNTASPCDPIKAFCAAPNVCTCLKWFSGSDCYNQATSDPLNDFDNDYIPEFSYINNGVTANYWTIQTSWVGNITQPNKAIRLVPVRSNTGGYMRSLNHFPLSEFSINMTIEVGEAVTYDAQGYSIHIITNSSSIWSAGPDPNYMIDRSNNLTGFIYRVNPGLTVATLEFSNGSTNSPVSVANTTTAALVRRRFRFRLQIVVRQTSVWIDYCDTSTCTLGTVRTLPSALPVGNATTNPAIIGISATNLATWASFDVVDFRVFSLAVCTRDCSPNGFCWKTGDFCYCRVGWTGPDCKTPICNCKNGGTCILPGECRCPPPFQGSDCNNPPTDAFFSPANCGKDFRLIQVDSFRQINATASECAEACRRFPNAMCRSFSHQASTSQCWLNYGHTNELWEGLELAVGWNYYHRETWGEGPLCKKNTYRDCLGVFRLGLGPGNYTFQTDIGARPFNTECITFPTVTLQSAGATSSINTSLLYMVFHSRQQWADWGYDRMDWNDYKWGFSSTTNRTKWMGLENGYRLMAQDFILIHGTSLTFCARLESLNTTTTYVTLRSGSFTTCTYFTHRQGNLMVATRSTCICQDPGSNSLVTCGCNTPNLAKYYFPVDNPALEQFVYEHYRPPFSQGSNRWSGTTNAPLSANVATNNIRWYALRARWDIVFLMERASNRYGSATFPRAAFTNESDSYRIRIPTWNSPNLIDTSRTLNQFTYNSAFLSPDRNNAAQNPYRGGFWMITGTWLTAANNQICFTCVVNGDAYAIQACCSANTNYDGRSFILLNVRPEGQ